jgi:hypothetical protein
MTTGIPEHGNPEKTLGVPDVPRCGERDPELFESGFFNQFYTKARAVDRIRAMRAAIARHQPFSFIRLGDAEASLVRFPLDTRDMSDPDAAARGEWIATHLGVNPHRIRGPVFDRFAGEFSAAALDADILGTHRHTVNAGWSASTDEMIRTVWGCHVPYLSSEVDVVFNAELFDQGYLLPILGAGRVLLVGPSAPEFARLVGDREYRRGLAWVGMPETVPHVAGVVPMVHHGTDAFDQLERTWTQIVQHDFDIALVAGSIIGKVMAGRIKKRLGCVALDIGWNMQYLSGVSSPVASATDPAYQRARRGYARLFHGRTGVLANT